MPYFALVGQLVSRTAVHVGSGRGGEVSDDLCRRDAAGNLVVPGTALAGALRSLATRLAPWVLGGGECKALRGDQDHDACGCPVCRLFGDINQPRKVRNPRPAPHEYPLPMPQCGCRTGSTCGSEMGWAWTA